MEAGHTDGQSEVNMELVFSGQQHNCGRKLLVMHDVNRVKAASYFDGLEGNQLIHVETDEYGLVIRTRAKDVDLHGNYDVELRLDKNEIANLAKSSLGGE